MKILRWLSENILLVFTLFLLVFIPLYPKLPLLDVTHTWVYIRVEDFLVAVAFFIYGIQVLRKKAFIRTPLTLPIILFWLVGAVSTLSAIYLIFPYIADAFPMVAILHLLRRVEYLSLFFIAYSAMRNKSFAKPVVFVLAFTLLLVVAYGLGQKGFIIGEENRFPAYLTMNEEFAKGIPLKLSALARIPSTFAGHYDLAAYLVMLIAIMGSLVFGFRNYFLKIFFLFCTISGLILLLLTASRVSFAVYLLTISFMLILQKKKLLIIPVIILSILFSQTFQGISQRFGNTISQVDLVVDARTGKAVGIAKEGSSPSSVVIEDVQSTGENLPQGTAYIQLPAAVEEKPTTKVVIKRSRIQAGTESAQITNVEGDFVVKRVLAYDVSFTTRFQGEWPRAIDAFKRNFLLGSGYSSISLATDNNYLRILGEIGIFGFLSFLAIFLTAGVYIRKVLPDIDSPLTKSLILGIFAGVFGLGLNAILIDVFEASKVAFVLWLLMGIALGLARLYQKQKINYKKEIIDVITSLPAMIVYLLVLSFSSFWMIFSNYFVGDDFTWLRWAADCKKIIMENGTAQCESIAIVIKNYFLQSDGFFYRPGTKVYFLFMHAIFGLNAAMYHVMSIALHFLNASVILLLSYKFLKNKFFAFLVAFFFLVLSSHAESLYWISVSGHLITSFCVLFALLMYIYFKDTRNYFYLLLSFVATITGFLFHEFGIITPFILLAYDVIWDRGMMLKKIQSYWYYIFFFATIPLYMYLRTMAKSHWLSGDYNYSLVNLPFNIFGNLLGYIALVFWGSQSLSHYTFLRTYGKEHVVIVIIGIVIVLGVCFILWKMFLQKITKNTTNIILFSLAFFILSLITFLGLGNITARYVYLPSFGILLLGVLFLQRLYERLRKTSLILGVIVVGIAIIVFSCFQYQELQRIQKDWQKAGAISNNLLISFNEAFQVAAITPQNPVFYFVNVPIRYGEAWVFPVGLSDALWFTFQNENLTVKQVPSLDIALDAAEGSGSARVFEFDKAGNVEEVIRANE
ncbi:MAG: O-antigen ligase family protein [Candidatus Levybacteria bacterium]|nr:O-antigen ligase family protein [Candidatus Levybacteria bacterium]